MFVHYSSIVKEKDEYATLNENDKVEFDITDGQKGPQASNVKITEKAPRQYRPRGGGGGGDRRGGERRGGFR